jgi:hypothetical protein
VLRRRPGERSELDRKRKRENNAMQHREGDPPEAIRWREKTR